MGAALGAALQARAQAAMGRRQETLLALGRAEDIVSHLDGDALVASALGYNEAQPRFHAGNALTHLGDREAAFQAQERALQLCMPGDYTDWALTRLDRASCLAAGGDAAEAVAEATRTLTVLDEPRRHGIITRRGRDVVRALPQATHASPDARELTDLLALTTDPKR